MDCSLQFMAILENPRYEAFAQARAKGARLDDAYEDAGFIPDKGHGSRLAQRKEVAERIAELRAEQARLNEVDHHALIAAMLRIAKAGEAVASPAGIKEARLSLLEARRLADDLRMERSLGRTLMLGRD